MYVIRGTGQLGSYWWGTAGTCSVVDVEDKEEEARLLEREDWKPYNWIDVFWGAVMEKVRGDMVNEIEMWFAFFFFYFSCCSNPMTVASFVVVCQKKKSLVLFTSLIRSLFQML